MRREDPDEQGGYLNDCVINVFNNYCLNKIITYRDKDAPWMTDSIKKLLMTSYMIVMAIQSRVEQDRLNAIQKECSTEISLAKENYLLKEGNKLNDPLLGPKRYWSILNRFLNKKKIPLIPPILEEGTLVTDILKKLFC